MKKLIEFYGIDPERLSLKWVSSAEGPRFAKVITEFVEKIREIGPSPFRPKVLMEAVSVEKAS